MRSTTRQSSFYLHDEVLNGRLRLILARYLADELSAREMARRLEEEHGRRVSYRTVLRWLADQSITKEDAA